MNLRPVLGAAATALVMAAGLGAGTPAVADDRTPVVVLDSATTSVGADLVAHGAGFTPGTLVLGELCGNEARRGSADCDQASAVNVGVGPAGNFTAHIRVSPPPTPCPCVVRLTAIGGTASATTPVTVVGAPVADPSSGPVEFPAVVRALEVTKVSVEDTGSWTEWFGASPSRVLVVTLRNSGTVAVDDPPIVLAVGKGAHPTGEVDSPKLGTLQPDEAREYRIPFELGPMAFGTYTIRGAIPGLADPLEFSGHTTSYPWALIIIPVAVVVQWLLLRGRNRLRDRIQPPAPETAPLALEAGDTATEPSSAPVLAGVATGAVATGAVATDDWPHTVDRVTREAIDALLEAVGDRLMTRGEIWSMADAVGAEVGADVADALELGAEERRTLELTVRDAADDALSTRELRATADPVTAGSR